MRDDDTARVVDFEKERDAGSTSWERADPRGASIRQVGDVGFLIRLPDSGDAHFCALAHLPDREAHKGICRCLGWQFHPGPCAHLCTIRQAVFGKVSDDDGMVVLIAQRDDLDGGDLVAAEHEAAQRSGEVFHGVHGHVERLPPRQREVFLAVEERGMEPREAADELGIEPTTARTHLHRARENVGGPA